MEFSADLVPPEEHDCKERRLHKERQDTFNGERSAENVPDKPGIVAPVSTEFELKDDTRGDTHGKIDSEELHPELGRLFPEFILLRDINTFHYSHDERQAKRQRDKYPVIAGGQGKLGPRPVDQCIFYHI